MKKVRAPRAYLVCVGSELLAGQVNTHQAWLSVRLRRAGFEMAGESSVPDSVALVSAALARAAQSADAVVVCGGLGPTFDDLTREAAADALGVSLTFKPALWEGIRKRFARYKVPVPEENKRQAYALGGAVVLDNPNGSAPGQRLSFRGKDGRPRTMVLLPGPFSEMSPIFERELPVLVKRHAAGVACASFSLRLVGVPESVADEKLDAVRHAHPDVEFTILASGGEVSFHATVRARTAAAAKADLAKVRAAAKAAVGRWSYGEGDDTLEGALGARLRRAKRTLAVAESCTGGLLGARLTSQAGSSDWFVGGVIAYSNELKTRLLRVPSATLKKHGAVSAESAAAMARGARRAARSDYALALTGVAGPGGGTKQKPVGLVYAALAGPDGTWTKRFDIHGPRESVRSRAATGALNMLKETLDGPSD